MEKNFRFNFLALILIIILLFGILLVTNTSYENIARFFAGLKGEEKPIFESERDIQNIWCQATLGKLIRLDITGRLLNPNEIFEVNSLRFAAASMSNTLLNSDMYRIDYSLFDSENLDGSFIPFNMTVFAKDYTDTINNNRIQLCSLWYSVNH